MKKLCPLFFFFIMSTSLSAQVGIGTDTPSEKAMLEISSQTNGSGPYRGFLPPRVASNTERDAINPGAEDKGLMVYVNHTKCIELWNGTAWVSVKCGEDLPYASDLFFSEYLEGTSGNNKALEIANYTGSTVNLNGYSIEGYNNDSTNRGYNHNLPSFDLEHGKTYEVVSNQSNVNQALIDLADARFNISYNGDDAVLLVKSGITIDILGEIGNSKTYAADIILRRKKFYGPSTQYIPAQFELIDPADYSDFGKHDYYE